MIPALGIQIEIPRDAEVDSDRSFGLTVRLHGVPPGTLELADTQYLVTVKVERTSESTYTENLDSLRRNVPRTPNTEWRYWMEERHPTISELDRGEFSYYRYDTACSGDELLRADVELRNLIADGLARYKAEDDRTIRRILGSLKCLRS
ncbi:MAG: hypothetical protein WA208_02700 [Thermoanaerobaculia bacterium]